MSTMTAESTTTTTGFTTMLATNAERVGNDPALSWLEEGERRSHTWRELHELVQDVAAGLVATGVQAGERVGILASNRPEHLIADHAIRLCGAVPVSLYVTMSTEQAQHILSDCSPSLLILEGDAVVERFSGLRWFIESEPAVITIDADATTASSSNWGELLVRGHAHRDEAASEIARRALAVDLDDPATLIYTSGTTGMPKGTIITHRNLLWDVEALIQSGIVDYAQKSVCFLPLAHITERVWSIYLALRTGGEVLCCPDAAQLLPTLKVFRPSFFMAVPRIWEKFATAAQVFISTSMTDRADEIAADREVLLEHWRKRLNEEPISAELSQRASLARSGSLRQVREFLGLERAFCCSGAAGLRDETIEFYASIGIRVIQGYGLTETSGPVITERPDTVPALGTVGIPLPGGEMKIADDGEILLRSPGNTPGYLHLPEKSAELYAEDGWLRTGDIGRIDEAGRLRITDRKKEIIVTATGKNVPPQSIENLLVGRSFIGQALAVGDARPYIVALIVPDPDLLTMFARTHGLEGTFEELLTHPVVEAAVAAEVHYANSKLSRPEQVKSWQLLPRGFSVEEGTLTPTLKVKRSAIHQVFSDEIDELYTRSRT
ncbi:long-chain acyl-CoA synthetase [Aeromicrobium choanae]|uniref:Acyl-CoA synthetase n=2 Tax=Aeromicrobium choanae TaxID=1736691 RepID=A0A1T4YRP6_9ACTN|nr:long-chain acyl-CoA synthetase [Aeromicrobium choanae]